MKKKYQDSPDSFYMNDSQKKLMATLVAEPDIRIAREIRDEFINNNKLLELADFHLCNKFKLELDSKDLSTNELQELYYLTPCVGGIYRHQILTRLALKAREEPESELLRLIDTAPEPFKSVFLSAQG